MRPDTFIDDLAAGESPATAHLTTAADLQPPHEWSEHPRQHK